MLQEGPIAPATTLYIKTPGFAGLYRHAVSGRYYGMKKLNGKRREKSLGTTDRKIAERRMKEWVGNMDKVDSEVEKTTLRQLLVKFEAITQSQVKNSQVTTRAIINHFVDWWSFGLDAQVRNIRPSHLDEFLAVHEPRLRNTTYNRYAGFLKQLFDIALNDRVIAESPFARVKTPWKRPQTPVRKIPTIQQFQAIVASIRSQRLTDHAQDSADFVEFLGLAGMGQAEASSLTWGDVDWELNRLNIRRHKTDTHFHVPIYHHLRPLLERLQAKADHPSARTRVFKINDAKKSLRSACERLGLPLFSQRNLRQCLIMRLWKAGIDKKLIAKWQGHRDGGQLIMDTYTEVFGDDEADYERQQLQKLAA